MTLTDLLTNHFTAVAEYFEKLKTRQQWGAQCEYRYLLCRLVVIIIKIRDNYVLNFFKFVESDAEVKIQVLCQNSHASIIATWRHKAQQQKSHKLKTQRRKISS